MVMTHQRPNLLFIMTDQQRFDAVGANGNRQIRTPHLDCLAAESANFSSFFVQAPVCVPSRQTFFTGRYPHSHKNRVNYTPLDERELLLQKHLQNTGYRTAFVGKLHYYPPTREHALHTGFDEGLIHDAAHTDQYSDYVAWLKAEAPQFATNYRRCRPVPGGNPFTATIPEEYHETTWCGRMTRRLLRELAGDSRPFFLFSSFWRPHAPFEVPEPWASMYDEIHPPLPEPVGTDEIARLPLPIQKLALRNGRDAHAIDRERLEWIYRSYYAAVSHIDYEVGKTLHVLDECGIADETIVVFCSDHGDLLLEHGIMGKNAFYEGAIHVPFMLRFPGVVVPGTYDELVESTDVLGTLCELAGVSVPYAVQGTSFAHRITGGKVGVATAPREFVFSENIIPEVITNARYDISFVKGKGVAGIRHPDAKMVRSRKYKYTYYVGHGEELFDLTLDPGERNNIADDPRLREVVWEMRQALFDWLITADETDQIAPRWRDI